ncbi:MAG: hypothetical protein JWN58_849, partial [Gammaproteobacteria bacterium]|nr:hypothetical protein [Gammaproteobacteria bacterium]
MRTGQAFDPRALSGIPKQAWANITRDTNPSDITAYDPAEGYLMRADVYGAMGKAQAAMNPQGFFADNGPFQAFSQTIGAAIGISGALSALGVAAAAAEGIGGGMTVSNTLAGTATATSTSVGTAAVASIPGSSVLGQSVLDLYDLYTAQDSIQAIAALDALGGGAGATAGAQTLGFNTAQQALASINPAFVSATTLAEIAQSAPTPPQSSSTTELPPQAPAPEPAPPAAPEPTPTPAQPTAPPGAL